MDQEDQSFIPGLFNTQLSDTISESFMAGIQSQKRHVDSANLRYAVLPAALPKNFDTRHVEGFPEADIPQWFFKDYKGNWITILATPIDQAGCGSCWAFSTATQFSDVIRFNLLKRYKDKACVSSIFFHPAFVCTGNSNIGAVDGKGVVNTNLVKVYGEELKYQISAYFTVSFSPHIKQCPTPPWTPKAPIECKDSPGGTTINLRCNKALADWKATISTVGKKPEDLKKLLADDFPSCLGCQGNLIVCPLMLFTGAQEESGGEINVAGAPLITEFTLHEWACLWGNDELRNRFCSEDFLSGAAVWSFPKLYTADSYSYITQENFKIPTTHVDGINSMEEWMMASIYNYGPITIGFSVYQSFMDFFKDRKNAKSVYTAKQFADDYNNGKNKKPLGGHAVVVCGWAESPVPHWIIRNSWGLKWADGGYFLVERNIDGKLPDLGIPASVKLRVESEFGSLYFAPGPNPELYDEASNNNAMKEFLLSKPLVKCPIFGGHTELIDEISKDCACRSLG
jgi:hypothetical protein